MSQVLHPHECDCSCGHDGVVQHTVACCDVCPLCNKRIKPFFKEEHRQECTSAILAHLDQAVAEFEAGYAVDGREMIWPQREELSKHD